MSGPHISQLASEILQNIFGELSLNDYVTAYSVCRRFKVEAERSMSTAKDARLDVTALGSRYLRIKGEGCNWAKLETLTIISELDDPHSLASVVSQFKLAKPEELTIHCHFVESGTTTDIITPASHGPSRHSLECRTLIVSGSLGSNPKRLIAVRGMYIRPHENMIQVLGPEADGDSVSYGSSDIRSHGPQFGMILLAEQDMPVGQEPSIRLGLCEFLMDVIDRIEHENSGQYVTLACQEPWSEEGCADLKDYIDIHKSLDSNAFDVCVLKEGERSVLDDALRMYSRTTT